MFNYDQNQFDLLTPAQSYLILERKKDYDNNNRLFLSNEFRTNSYFNVVFSGNVKKGKIKKPSDLYQLDNDEKPKQKIGNMDITSNDIDFIKRKTGLTILNSN